jgi:hypothetical protein
MPVNVSYLCDIEKLPVTSSPGNTSLSCGFLYLSEKTA